MLAKIWKKLLLAICIIACLFNITSKIVNRTSLEVNLKQANDGTGILDILKKDENTTSKSDIIDGVKETVVENTSENNDNKVENEKSEKSINSDFVVLY